MSKLKAYSDSKSGFGTTTFPGSESNTFPMSSMLGARNAVEILAWIDSPFFNLTTAPALPLSAPGLSSALLKENG